MAFLGRAVYTLGLWIRESGQALDRLGSRLQGSYYFQEQLSRHRTLMNLNDKAPVADKDAFVAPNASIIGDVLVGPSSSIWYGCVLRGDLNTISIGTGTNIQDNSVVHVTKSNLAAGVLPTIIGNNVTVGHAAVLHACTVEDEACVGMGATLLDGVVVEKNAMVAAGALVRQNTRIPAGEALLTTQLQISYKKLHRLTDENSLISSKPKGLTHRNLDAFWPGGCIIMFWVNEVIAGNSKGQTRADFLQKGNKDGYVFFDAVDVAVFESEGLFIFEM